MSSAPLANAQKRLDMISDPWKSLSLGCSARYFHVIRSGCLTGRAFAMRKKAKSSVTGKKLSSRRSSMMFERLKGVGSTIGRRLKAAKIRNYLGQKRRAHMSLHCPDRCTHFHRRLFRDIFFLQVSKKFYLVGTNVSSPNRVVEREEKSFAPSICHVKESFLYKSEEK